MTQLNSTQLSATQLNSTQWCFISINIYSIDQLQHCAENTLVYLPHCYWVDIVHRITSVINTNWFVHVYTQKHIQKCVWQIFQEKQIFSRMKIAYIKKTVQKCIHSRCSLGFIKWKLIVIYFNRVDTLSCMLVSLNSLGIPCGVVVFVGHHWFW